MHTGAETYAYGALDSIINTGAGNDGLHINANTNDNTNWDPAVGLSNTLVDLGRRDSLHLNANANGSWGSRSLWSNHTTINTDDLSSPGGDDYISINASANSNWWDNPAEKSTAIAFDKSTLNTGAGNDQIHLNANATVRNLCLWSSRFNYQYRSRQ